MMSGDVKMKKLIAVVILVILCVSVLSGCGCEHDWKEATCTEAKSCSLCGETEGEPAGHGWNEATCTEPKTCSACSLTEGEALGHSWVDATYEAPKTCSVCGLTEGDPLEDTSAADEFFASAGFEVVSSTIESGLSVNHSIYYDYIDDPENPYPLLYIYLYPLAGAADAYTADRTMWATFTENIRTFSERAGDVFIADNHTVVCCVVLFDDRNTSEPLYVAANGVVAYDFLAE